MPFDLLHRSSKNINLQKWSASDFWSVPVCRLRWSWLQSGRLHIQRGLDLHRCHSHRVNVGSLTAFIITQDLFINPQQPFTYLMICCCGMSAGDPEYIKIICLKNIIRLNLTNGIFWQTDRWFLQMGTWWQPVGSSIYIYLVIQCFSALIYFYFI